MTKKIIKESTRLHFYLGKTCTHEMGDNQETGQQTLQDGVKAERSVSSV